MSFIGLVILVFVGLVLLVVGYERVAEKLKGASTKEVVWGLAGLAVVVAFFIWAAINTPK